VNLVSLAELIANGDPLKQPAREQWVQLLHGRSVFMWCSLERTAVIQVDEDRGRELARLSDLYADPEQLRWQSYEPDENWAGFTSAQRKMRGLRGARAMHLRGWRCSRCDKGAPQVRRYTPKSGMCIECARTYQHERINRLQEANKKHLSAKS
jgi:hypothetical protein